MTCFPQSRVRACATIQLIELAVYIPALYLSARFCGAEGLSNVVMLSSIRNPEFRTAYGVDLQNGPLAGLCARAVVVLDENDQVLYSQLVSEIKDEPDYAAALAAL